MCESTKTKIYLPDDVRRASLSTSNEASYPLEDDEWIESQVIDHLHRKFQYDGCTTTGGLSQKHTKVDEYLWCSNKTSSNRWLLQRIRVPELGDISSKIPSAKIAWIFLESCSMSRPVPCLLRGRLLHMFDLSSSSKMIPLLDYYDCVFPTHQGVLLVNHLANKLSLLTHHEEPMIDIRIPANGNLGKVVWSSSRLPILASRHSSRGSSFIKLWKIVVGQAGEILLEGLKEKYICGQAHIDILEENQTENHIIIVNDDSRDARSSVTMWYLKDLVVVGEKIMDESVDKVLPLHINDTNRFLLVLMKDGGLWLWSSDGKRRLFDLAVQMQEEYSFVFLTPRRCSSSPIATPVSDVSNISGSYITISYLDGQEVRAQLSILPLSCWMRENLDSAHFPSAGKMNDHILNWRHLLETNTDNEHMIENCSYKTLQESVEHRSVMDDIFQEGRGLDNMPANNLACEMCLNTLDANLVYNSTGLYRKVSPRDDLFRTDRCHGRTAVVSELSGQIKDLCSLFSAEEHPELLRNGALSIARGITNCLLRNKWSIEDIQKLPLNFAVPILLLLKVAGSDPDAIQMKQNTAGFVLMDRPDLAALSKCFSLQDSSYNMFHEDVIIQRMDEDVRSILESIDGYVDNLTPEMMEHRFGRDTRVFEARRILSSSDPVPLFLKESAHSGEADAKQQQLKLLSNRTLAVSVGRGAMSLCTHQALPTEPLSTFRINLSGRIVDGNDAIVDMDLTQELPAPGGGAVCKLTAWPEFHNGVASALRIAPGGTLSRTWIVYNKSDEPSYEHAGILLGLGLTGQLSCLTMTDLYSYLSHEHDPTLVGILLGMSSSKRCSMDPTLTKMLFLHLPARHPIGYPDLEISPVVQCASLVGLGQLYLGSAQRSIVETLLQEIERSPRKDGEDKKQVNDFTKGYRSYSLCAGFALGLVCLGKGSDPDMEAKLQYLMVGGTRFGNVARKSTLAKVCDANSDYCHEDFINDLISSSVQNPGKDSQRSSGVAEELAAAQADARTIMEGDLINLNTTSPAATVALGFMYLKSGNKRIANIFHIPASIFELRLCNPQHLCIRILMKNLILWDEVEASSDWMEAQIPEFLHESSKLSTYSDPDLYLLSQARFFLLSGCCLTLGIRFAGSGNASAKALIGKQMEDFLTRKSECLGNRDRKDNLEILESCIVDCAVSLGVLMAGSGDLTTFAMCRALLNRVPTSMSAQNAITYGSYVGLSMAIGFLFLSGGMRTFGTSIEDVAYLIMSIFPVLSVSSSDNIMHLQALRHFYVLATHQRILDQVDVRSNKYLESPIKFDDIESDREVAYGDKGRHLEFERYFQRSFEGVPGVEIDNAFRSVGIPPSILGYFHESSSLDVEGEIDFTCENFATRIISATFPRLLGSILQILSSDSVQKREEVLDLWSTLLLIPEKIHLCGFPVLHENALQMLCAQSLGADN